MLGNFACTVERSDTRKKRMRKKKKQREAHRRHTKRLHKRHIWHVPSDLHKIHFHILCCFLCTRWLMQRTGYSTRRIKCFATFCDYRFGSVAFRATLFVPFTFILASTVLFHRTTFCMAFHPLHSHSAAFW